MRPGRDIMEGFGEWKRVRNMESEAFEYLQDMREWKR